MFRGPDGLRNSDSTQVARQPFSNCPVKYTHHEIFGTAGTGPGQQSREPAALLQSCAWETLADGFAMSHRWSFQLGRGGQDRHIEF